jgi:hypothetical protein
MAQHILGIDLGARAVKAVDGAALVGGDSTRHGLPRSVFDQRGQAARAPSAAASQVSCSGPSATKTALAHRRAPSLACAASEARLNAEMRLKLHSMPCAARRRSASAHSRASVRPSRQRGSTWTSKSQTERAGSASS